MPNIPVKTPNVQQSIVDRMARTVMFGCGLMSPEELRIKLHEVQHDPTIAASVRSLVIERLQRMLSP